MAYRFGQEMTIGIVVYAIVGVVLGFGTCAAANGQTTDGVVAVPSGALEAAPSFAILGPSMGVAKIAIPMTMYAAPGSLATIEVIDDENRVMFTTTRDMIATPSSLKAPGIGQANGDGRLGGGRLIRRVSDLVRQAIGDNDKPQIVAREVTFLFRGDGPLRLRLSTSDPAAPAQVVLNPIPPIVPEDYTAAINRWWDSFTDEMSRSQDAGDYNGIVQSYLVAYLSGRLELPLPAEFIVDASAGDPSMVATLKMLAGTEKIRRSLFRQAAIGKLRVEPMDQPLPATPRWSMTTPEKPTVAPEIEPLATRVPPECFYIRYGSFENYLWFNDLSYEYGGDIGRMVAVRGSDQGATSRVEDQLNLKMTVMSRMLGGSVIADQAIVGRDLFLSEGASLGVMFRAKNAFLLQTSLNSDRTSKANDSSVKLTTERIADHDVTFLRTIDNSIRSFMVVDGDTIFVANSRELIKRFLEVGQSGESLAATTEFQLARELMPLSRADTVFVYFSPAMMRGLVAPSSIIELRRRLFALADISLLRLGRLAAAADGDSIQDPQALIDAGYLPSGFLTRSDGSGVIVVEDDILDSMRGRPGTFLPIADAKIINVTASEASWYQRISAYYESEWPQLDPIFFGVRRSDVPDHPSRQRLELHGEIAPLEPDKYGMIAKQLGPPTPVRIDFAPDDIVAGQAHIASDQLGGSIPPHHLFAAIKDTLPPPPDQFNGILKIYQSLRVLPGYLGAWPQPGLLDRLPLGLGRGEPMGPGLTRLIGGVYRFQGNGFSVVSLQSDVLLASLPFLAANESETSAQIRLKVGNLLDSQLEGWVNDQFFKQNFVKSQSGAELLTMLTRQLRVPPEQALATAETLLGGPLQDPLGGTYHWTEVPSRSSTTPSHRAWISDAWPIGDEASRLAGNAPTAPAGYVAPVLSWFRGGSAELTQYSDRVVVDAVIDVERKRSKVVR